MLIFDLLYYLAFFVVALLIFAAYAHFKAIARVKYYTA